MEDKTTYVRTGISGTGLITIILVLAKVFGYINLSWLWVFSLLWVPWVAVVAAIVGFIAVCLPILAIMGIVGLVVSVCGRLVRKKGKGGEDNGKERSS